VAAREGVPDVSENNGLARLTGSSRAIESLGVSGDLSNRRPNKNAADAATSNGAQEQIKSQYRQDNAPGPRRQPSRPGARAYAGRLRFRNVLDHAGRFICLEVVSGHG